jgi:hypothetical protein
MPDTNKIDPREEAKPREDFGSGAASALVTI